MLADLLRDEERRFVKTHKQASNDLDISLNLKQDYLAAAGSSVSVAPSAVAADTTMFYDANDVQNSSNHMSSSAAITRMGKMKALQKIKGLAFEMNKKLAMEKVLNIVSITSISNNSNRINWM